MMIVIERTGEPKLWEKIPYTMLGPWIRGFFFWPARNELVVRMEVDHSEVWRMYSLDDYRLTASHDPRPTDSTPEVAWRVLDTIPIQDTPLLLVREWRYDRTQGFPGAAGARYLVFDPDLTVIWDKALNDDYRIRPWEDSVSFMWGSIEGAKLIRSIKPKHFEIVEFTASTWREYRLVKVESSEWSVEPSGSTREADRLSLLGLSGSPGLMEHWQSLLPRPEGKGAAAGEDQD